MLEGKYEKLSCEECIKGGALDFDFKMAFQPIVDIRTKSIFSQEALVRGLGGEPAGTILGKVNDKNRYRFDQVCRVKAIEAAARLHVDSYVNINFIPGAIYNPQTCIRTTLDAAEKFGFKKSRIIFEVTEGEKISDHQHLINIFAEYKKHGFLTAIDDFGAGYAGLNLLAEFQPDIIKLDMALIRSIDKHRVRSIIVDAILRVCEEIGIQVIAEGVETAEEFHHLAAKGIYLFQGYYFARPAFDAAVKNIDPVLMAYQAP